MHESEILIDGCRLRLITVNTVVVGTGAAGFNAADRLFQYGQKDMVLVTENIRAGTSRNTGSDKQTYYKLSMSGDDLDSVRKLADTLYAGQCVDGDVALCEAALSAQCFLRLAELGVPFPRSRYGEYVGYKTDHDPCRRATSVGPYTSRMMTECLERSVLAKGIPILDHLQMIRILTKDGAVCGLLCINLEASGRDDRYVAFCCANVLLATGGPASMYADSVYPIGHYGATGVAFEAGAKGQNLTEWQFGLASVRPRWNVSGTYMQVLPRFISTAPDGRDEREFLSDYFHDQGDMLSKVFLKGYQWPFDARKAADGSSVIDILVYIETCLKGRRVFLDFTENPGQKPLDCSLLSPEARDYLTRAGACFGTPVERLAHMNTPAVEFYRSHGIDLHTQRLEIALCAQHNNGGLAIDAWWQTNVEGLFAAGEVSGSHGVYRPGGSALNAGQVGSTRAAMYIAAKRDRAPADEAVFLEACGAALAEYLRLADAVMGPESNLPAQYEKTTVRMSQVGGAIRNAESIRLAMAELAEELQSFSDRVRIASPEELPQMFRLRETMICQTVYLSAMEDYIREGGRSRGSAIYSDKNGGTVIRGLPSLPEGPELTELFRFSLEEAGQGSRIQEASYENGVCSFAWRDPRPIPDDDDFFENVWRAFRVNENIY